MSAADVTVGGATVPATYAHVYLHVPFCARRCSYCDFAIAVRREVPWRAFAGAVARECDARGVSGQREPLATLYLGGGTPSRLGPAGARAVLDALHERFAVAPGAEVTLEANPEDITAEAVAAWHGSGVTRLSLGVQSFDDQVLTWMHRVHDAAGAERAVRTARDGGLTAYSLDLIFATPERFARDWERDLDRLLELAPDHVSLYGLTVEPHTPLGRWHARGEEREASEEVYAREFLLAHERLTAAGYEHYEVSSFARPGKRARHNSAYWRGVPYLGLGPSAHGFDGVSRRWNLDAYVAWESAVAAGHDPVGGEEALSGDSRAAEAVYLGLRTSDGLSVSPAEADYASAWVEAGWVTLQPTGADLRLICTAHGWLRLDALAAALTAFRSGP